MNPDMLTLRPWAPVRAPSNPVKGINRMSRAKKLAVRKKRRKQKKG